MNDLLDSTHYTDLDALVAQALPPWLTGAEPALRQAYFASSRVCLDSSAKALPLAQGFQSPEAFCRPLLQAALDRQFPGLHLDADRHELIRMQSLPGGYVMPRHQTLLQAAMQNFKLAEAVTGGIEAHSLILPIGRLRTRIGDDGSVRYVHDRADELAITPEAFAAVVRGLDLGRQYQAHFKSVFRPLSTVLPSVDKAQADIATQLMLSLRDRLDVQCVVARIMGNIDSGAYAMLRQITHPTDVDQVVRWAGRPVRFSQVRLLYSRVYPGHSLQGVLMIEQADGNGPCLVYRPNDPQAQLKQYASASAFALALREQLRSPDYLAYMRGFVTYRSQDTFVTRLNAALAPTPVPWPGQFEKPPVANPDADIGLRPEPYDGSLTRLMYNQYLTLIAENARTFVVPVEDQDDLARRERQHWWERVGLLSLDVLAFVPVVGEFIAAVGAIALVKEVCIGVDDWTHGQKREALEHFAGVAQNVALVAAGVAAGAAFTRSSVLQALERAGGVNARQLVHPQLPGYAVDLALPSDAVPNAMGQYVMDGQHYVQIDGRCYRQAYDEQAKHWVIEHPGSATAEQSGYRPIVKHNGAGGWQHVHDQPLSWKGIELLKRAGSVAAGLSDDELAQALQVNGVSEAQLRECHFNHEPLPPLLQASLRRMQAQAQIDRLVAKASKAGSDADALEQQRATRVEALLAAQVVPLVADAEPLKRVFPGLPNTEANRLVDTASAAERLQLSSQGKVPSRVAEQALMVLREQRLTQACEGLARASLASDDRDRLALGLLARLSGWNGGVRVELRGVRFDGELIAQAGPASASEVKVIVRRNGHYRAYDQYEQELAADQNLFAALCSALPDRQMQALRLPRGAGETLRGRLLQAATEDRVGAGKLLGQRQVQPWFRAPELDPQGIGYPLSGRTHPNWSQRSRLRQLYPSLTDAERIELAAVLRRPQEGLELALQRLEQEYRTLHDGLLAWESQGTGRATRQRASARILRAWRRQTDGLDLSGLVPDTLPVITADFSHIQGLHLRGLPAGTDVGLFLSRFPNLETLSLRSNRLTRIPEQITTMGKLRRLDLSDNRLEMSDDTFLPLLHETQNTTLVTLVLRQSFGPLPALGQSLVPVELSGRMLEPLTRMKQLRLLDFSSHRFSFSDDALAVIGGMTHLQGLRLSDCFLELSGVRSQALARLTRLHTLDLSGALNGLGNVDLSALRNLSDLSLHHCQLTQWPTGLSELMDIQPVRLRMINLGDNALMELPPLSELEFVRARQTYLQGQLHLNLNFNPLNAASASRLRLIGLSFQPARVTGAAVLDPQAWLQGCPAELRARIDADRICEDSAAFYRVLDQSARSGGYLQDPQTFRARIWTIMHALLPEPGVRLGEGQGDGLGVRDLRQQLFDRASLIENTCGDGISLALDDFETRVLAWQAASSAVDGGEAMFTPLLALARQLHKAALVDEYAVALTQARMNRREALLAGDPAPALLALDGIDSQRLLDSVPDEVEIRLMLRTQLQVRLDLRRQPVRRYGEYVAQLTVDQVGALVQERATDLSLMAWLEDQSFWEVYLRKVFRQRFETVDAFWAEVMSHFEDATDPAAAQAVVTENLPEILATLTRLDSEVSWKSPQGAALKVTLDERASLRLYNAIEQGRRDARAQLIRALSSQVMGEGAQA